MINLSNQGKIWLIAIDWEPTPVDPNVVWGLIVEVIFWLISAEVKYAAYKGFIWTVNWKLGMKETPVKLKVIKNQYWEFVIYCIVVWTDVKVLTTLTVKRELQIVQPVAKITFGIVESAIPW